MLSSSGLVQIDECLQTPSNITTVIPFIVDLEIRNLNDELNQGGEIVLDST